MENFRTYLHFLCKQNKKKPVIQIEEKYFQMASFLRRFGFYNEGNEETY